MGQEGFVADLLKDYCDALEAMDECDRQSAEGTRRWNALVDQMQALQLQLRQSAEGRDGITALIYHPSLTVRLWSATHALAWAPGQARSELEREVVSGGVGAFEAKVTLREFDAGRLDTTWEPMP